jgi:hypothetical protein
VAKQGKMGEKWPLNFAYEASFHACGFLLHALSKIYFTKTTEAKSMSCVRMERKSLKVLISMV